MLPQKQTVWHFFCGFYSIVYGLQVWWTDFLYWNVKPKNIYVFPLAEEVERINSTRSRKNIYVYVVSIVTTTAKIWWLQPTMLWPFWPLWWWCKAIFPLSFYFIADLEQSRYLFLKSLERRRSESYSFRQNVERKCSFIL